MAISPKGITLHEGYNNLGTFEIDITDVEQTAPSVVKSVSDFPPVSKNLIFKLEFLSGEPIPLDFKGTFTVKGRVESEWVQYEEYPNENGYIEIDTPVLPVVVRKIPDGSPEETVIRYTIEGPLDSRAEETYMAVVSLDIGPMYTLIWDFFVSDGHLTVFDGVENYYELGEDILVGADITAIHITRLGVVYGYDGVEEEWVSLGTLEFTRIEFPENLISYSDGFYIESGSSGSVEQEVLGTGIFDGYTLTVNNPENYLVDVAVLVTVPGTSFFSGSFTNLMPGSVNYVPVIIDGVAPVPTDNSPTLELVQSISGVTFSAEFLDFLALKELGTVEAVRKAGPITYIDDYPAEDVGAEELAALQSHTDLYMVNKNIEQNQHIIDEGYGKIYDIANTPKDVFVTDVVYAGLSLFRAAQIHEVVTQNQKLVSSMLANRLTDMRMAGPVIPFVPGSNFPAAELHAVASSCGCDDCKSGISPFAYMMDLLKYGAAHIDNSPSFIHGGTQQDLEDFVDMLEVKFIQPFGELNVSCETLHDEFCRVRLVTEVLELCTLLPGRLTALAKERELFWTLVYKTILTQAGTSINEVRDIVAMPYGAEKSVAVEKWAAKMGLPVYVPTTSTLTVEAVWLTIGNANPNNELKAENLEAIFGFRDTKRDVLTVTPVPFIELWQDAFMRSSWKKQDYLFSDYSREGVDPMDNSTFKANWKPIIDPDQIGWQDMTYQLATFAKELWLHRKEETDRLLTFCVEDPTMVSEIALDEKSLILKVDGIDISTENIKDDKIYYEAPASTWNDYTVFAKALNGTNTDIVLDQSLYPFPIQQPVSTTLRYRKELLVQSISGTTTVVLNWTGDVNIINALSFSGGAYIKLESTAGSSPYETAPPGVSPLLISNAVFNSNQQVTLTLSSPGINGTFTGGTMKFTYTVEVPLVTEIITDPEKLTEEMFTVQQEYTLFPPAFTTPDPFLYDLWDEPVSWPATITAVTYVGKLKQMQEQMGKGIDVATFKTIIESNMRMSTGTFSRMMELIRLLDSYVKNIFGSLRPTTKELFELASILQTCGKTQLLDLWVKEEIKYPDPSVNPEILQLSGTYFWKSVIEPVQGSWDPSLQPQDVALIDPELISRNMLIDIPESQIYLELYDDRKEQLDLKEADYLAYITDQDSDAFTNMLNDINQGSDATPYDISPYASMTALLVDLRSNNVFDQKKAADVIWTAFTIERDDFLKIADAMIAYEGPDPELMPSYIELQKIVKQFVSAFKRLQLYPNSVVVNPGWLEEEEDGTYTTPNVPVLYYNVLKMRLDPVRGSKEDRSAWQHTLAEWNRMPFVQPDIVPPENIKEFILANPIYTTWNLRKIELNTAYSTLATTYIYPGASTADVLLENLQGQIDLLVGRVDTYTPLPGTPPFTYFPFFEAIKDKDENGEDIRPYVLQLGFTIMEYRYLANIIKVLTAAGSGAIPLLETEYVDVINILIAAHSRIYTFDDVLEEYTDDIILTQEYFQIYKQPLNNFPLTNIPIYNAWRSPLRLRKDWEDTLEGRIEREKFVDQKWKDVLQEAEDQNMPLMRDALLRAMTPDCVDWHLTAERMARSLFIETKDNCCVKHTRVSFAIETLQGLYFALQNGIFDDSVSTYKLIAPQFKEEWEWLGTYSAWRSAIFVFLYPENLLYPTLKRQQSLAFVQLSQTLQSANRFSPENACDLAKKFDTYIQDIQHLETICTTTADALLHDNEKDCCIDILNNPQPVTFFFAQSKLSGKCYSMSVKNDQATFTNDSTSYWDELPIPRKHPKLLACFALGDRYPQDWSIKVYNLALYAFYSYFDEGKLKLAYLKKDLGTYNSPWSDEEDLGDLPQYLGVRPSRVFACQNVADWISPAFLLSYDIPTNVPHNQTTTKVHNIVAQFSKKDNNIALGNLTQYNYGAGFITDGQGPDFAVRHLLSKPSSIPPAAQPTSASDVLFECVTVVYGEKLFVFAFNVSGTKFYATPVSTTNLGPDGPMVITTPGKKVIGLFDSKTSQNSLIIVYQNANGTKTYNKLHFSFNRLAGNTIQIILDSTTTISPSGTIFPRINGYLPVHTQGGNWPIFAVKTNFTDDAIGYFLNNVYPSTTLTGAKSFYVSPKNITDVSLQSADCISDMPARANKIKTKIKGNMTPDSPTIPMIYTTKMIDVLYEAYYFVPMLLALDQQKRGQFETALSWYRSVYDYTSNLVTNRKIFYGLVIEELINSTYTQSANWLLDPLNPHLIAQTRTNAYTKYTVMNIIQCLYGWADREFTIDTAETVPIARKLYSVALDLLKIKELQPAPNQCKANATNCVKTLVTTIPPTSIWNNQAQVLENRLAQVRDPELIDTLAEEIADILNAADEDTFAEKFIEAFDLVDENLPPDPEPENITTVLQASTERFTNAYRYMFASDSQPTFAKTVEDNYAKAVAGISGIDVAELETPEGEAQIDWLNRGPAENDLPMDFEFANSDGDQLLPVGLSYNPVKPSPRSYTSNLIFYNAPFVIGAYQNNMPVGYTPLLDFKFCIPNNPVYQGLEMKANLELYKIFNCRNIAGMIRELSVYSAATDSVTGIPIIGASGNLITPGIGTYSPSQYRFRVLVERAKQIVSQAQQMESMFLAALEKEDAENYSQLRAKQDLETARATVKLQDIRITQANDEKIIANTQLNKATFTQQHFNNLLAEGLNGFEDASLALLSLSVYFQFGAAGLYIAASSTSGATPSGISGVFSNAAAALSATSGAIATSANILAQLASYQRRAQEWSFQKDLAGFDITLANQQVKVADDNVRIVTQERQIAQMNTDHAQDSLQFLQNKFTNAELYNWMGGVLQSSYSYMLNLSTAIARTAEKQLFFERQEQAGPFILSDYWETPSSGFTSGSSGSAVDRRGLTGSARLLVDLTRLDQFAFDTNKRKLQMTKVISLAQNFPSEFQAFKETGVLNFSLTNQLFDYDFPGHYLRLISQVKTTVVGLLPVYDQVKATLTADTLSYTVIGGTTFQRVPIKRMEVDSVALTSANNATGIFEMQPMQNELLNPFEGMGIESRWELKMPQFSNRFDFSNIADVLLTVEYTALDSYQYRYQVLQELDNEISFNRGFSFKNNFPDQWYALAETEANNDPTVEIDIKREMFPQGIDNLKLNGSDILLYFVREDYENEISVSSLNISTSNVLLEPNDTTNGIYRASQLTTSLQDASPVMKLKLILDESTVELFNEGKIKDIILLLACRADLKSYPL